MKSLLFALFLPALAAVAADAPKQFKVGDYTFSRPAKWESVEPSSAMRKAQLRVPGEKASADVIFFYFGPGDGGGTQANVDRWLGQFSNATNKKVNETKVGKRKVIYVSTEGTYAGGMPGHPGGGELANYALLGAIVESDNGNVFIKMTGPTTVVKSADSDFRKMVEGALK